MMILFSAFNSFSSFLSLSFNDVIISIITLLRRQRVVAAERKMNWNGGFYKFFAVYPPRSAKYITLVCQRVTVNNLKI